METERLTLTIPPGLAGKRLDQALASLCPQHSRSRLQSWIRGGRVRVDGRIMRQRDSVRGGETVEVLPSFENVVQPARAEDIPLEILYEDDAVLILNKPPGIVVHPGAGNPAGTLLNALLHHAPQLSIVPRAGIVQRLDKDTSGVMVVAKSPSAHTCLVERMKRREIRREYEALVHGVLTSGGRIEAPIGRHAVERRRMAVNVRGRPAITHYRVIHRYRAFTHLRILLETGRTHQIRVHLAHIHHPVVGDRSYGGRARAPQGASEYLRKLVHAFPRQALHASELSLVHPQTGLEMHWRAPLPDDLRALLRGITRET